MDEESVKTDWTKKVVIHLIESWKEHECLYNPKHAFYHNRQARLEALNDITEDIQHFIPSIGQQEIKSKMTYLRGQYTREIAKMKESKRGSDMYEPTAFWFESLSFLKDFVTERKKVGSSISNSIGDSNYDSSSQCMPAESRSSPSPKRIKREEYIEASSISADAPNCTDNKSDENFCKFMQSEMAEITNKCIKDELKEALINCIFRAKKQQRK